MADIYEKTRMKSRVDRFRKSAAARYSLNEKDVHIGHITLEAMHDAPTMICQVRVHIFIPHLSVFMSFFILYVSNLCQKINVLEFTKYKVPKLEINSKLKIISISNVRFKCCFSTVFNF